MNNNFYNHNCNIHIHFNDTDCQPECDFDAADYTDDDNEDRTHTPDGYCTMCGKKLDDFDKQEEFGFDYHVGYGSIHDGEILHSRFCCKCFDGIVDIIDSASVYNPVVDIR